jgi:hypothetical protein
MRIEPRISLVFNGECDAAFTLYQQCLGGTVTFRLTWGDSPMADQAPAEWRDKILHATLMVGGTALSGGDVLPGQYERPQGFQLQLNLDDAAAAAASSRSSPTADGSPFPCSRPSGRSGSARSWTASAPRGGSTAENGRSYEHPLDARHPRRAAASVNEGP